ncbi:MAG TPA: hypothetical protein VMP01_27240 [Pirellulaceae bacterium]|nr:hypothetical protein [Pirellulaceae bacterium]
MDSVVKRPWYRLHWVTWTVMAVLLLAFVNRQMAVQSGSWASPFIYAKWTHFGWPVVHLDLMESGAALPGSVQPNIRYDQPVFKYDWRPLALAVNVFTLLLFLGSTAFVVESFLRNYRKLQFSVGNLIVITGVLGVILALFSYEPAFLFGARWLFGLELSYLIVWRDFQRPLLWPVLFGLACTLYSLGWLGLAILCRAYRLVRP